MRVWRLFRPFYRLVRVSEVEAIALGVGYSQAFDRRQIRRNDESGHKHHRERGSVSAGAVQWTAIGASSTSTDKSLRDVDPSKMSIALAYVAKLSRR